MVVGNHENNSRDAVQNEKRDQRKIAAEHTEQCRVNKKLQLELRVADNAKKKTSHDHRHEIAIATQINEQLCKEVEAKGELIALFSQKFDEQCSDNIKLARDKVSTATVMKGLIRDQQTRDALVDHLQIQLEESRTKKANAIWRKNWWGSWRI